MKVPVNHNDPSSQWEYFEHLGTITLKAKLYRRYYLYPRVNRYLTGKTLDFGCGLGDFISYRKNSLGVDINPFSINYCKEKNLNVCLINDPPYQFDAESFDSIFLDNVLEHIEDPDDLLSEINRMLKPEGRFIVGVPSIKGFQAHADHKKYYDKKTLVAKLSEFEFSLYHYFYAPFKLKFFEKNLSAYCLYAVFTKNII